MDAPGFCFSSDLRIRRDLAEERNGKRPDTLGFTVAFRPHTILNKFVRPSVLNEQPVCSTLDCPRIRYMHEGVLAAS